MGESMKRFANDAKCVEYLKVFKSDTEVKMAAYQNAMVAQMKQDVSERALKQLQSVAQFEAGMGSAMQELVVQGAADSFREQYPNSSAMQDQAFSAAVKSLSGAELGAGEDPVAAHFAKALKSLEGVDLMTSTGNPSGTLAERVAYAQQAKEKDFQNSFMVTAAEAAEVKSLAQAAKTDNGFDFSKLPSESLSRINALYTSINNKVGYALPAGVGSKAIEASNDAAANSYIDGVNPQLAASMKEPEN